MNRSRFLVIASVRGLASMADLQVAAELFDARGIVHGEIKPLEPFGIAVLAFRGPGNIQVELTAPYSQ